MRQPVHRTTSLVMVFAALSAAWASAADDSCSVRSVDFRNFAFPTSLNTPETGRFAPVTALGPVEIRLTDGTYRQSARQPGQPDEESPYAFLERVLVGDLTPAPGEEAVVHVRVSTGGTLAWNYLYLVEMRRCSPAVVQAFLAGDRGLDGIRSVRIHRRNLMIEINDAKSRSGDCCSSASRRYVFRWSGVSLVQTGKERLVRSGSPNR